MPEQEIRIKTSADLSGVQAVQKHLLTIRDLAQEISKNGIRLPTAGETPQTFTETARQRGGAGHGAPTPAQPNVYRPATPNGQHYAPSGVEVEKWWERNTSTGNGITGSTSQDAPKPQKYAPKPGTFDLPGGVMKKYTTTPSSPERPQQWVNEAWRLMNSGKLVPTDVQAKALVRAMGGGEAAKNNYYHTYAAEANMFPVPQAQTETVKQREAVGGTFPVNQVVNRSYPTGAQRSSPSGAEVGEWMEQNMPIVNAMMGKPASRTIPKPPKYVPKPGTIPTPANVAKQYKTGGRGTPEYIKDWFMSVGKTLTPGTAAHDEWQGANMSWVQGESGALETFYQRHSAEANMVPVPQVQTGGSGGGGAGGAGKALGSLLPSRGIGGAIGSLAGGIGLPGLAIGGLATAAIGIGVSSVSQYMKSGAALSGLTKQILATHDGLSKLMDTVHSAGASFGYMASQSDKVANTLGTAYGNMTLTQMGTKVGQTLGFARAYGMPSDVVAQGFAGAAQLGLTTGPGSRMNMGQFGWGLASSAARSGMSGRMTELMQEVLQATQSIESSSVTTNPSSLLQLITGMNAHLPRSMQGAQGAAILGKLSSGIANPGMGGVGQMLEWQAFGANGVSNYWQYLHGREMGPSYVLPSGKTSLQAILSEATRTWGTPKLGNAASGYRPGNQAAGLEEYILQQMYGISMPQAGAMLSLFGPGGPGVKGPSNTLGLTPGQLKSIDMGKLGLLGQLNEASTLSQLQAVQKQWEAGGGKLSAAQQKALGATTSVAEEKKILASDILGSNYKPLTSSEKLDSAAAAIQKSLIGIGGNVAKITTKIVGTASSFMSPAPGHMAKPVPGRSLREGRVAPTSFITSGGAQYSSGLVQTMMGLHGMNNAFAWIPSGGSGGTSSGGPQYMMYHGSGSVALSGGTKDFVAKMRPYAEEASQRTGLPTDYILGQWGNESGWGVSAAARQNLNFAGIKPFGGLSAGPDAKYAGFSSLNAFVRAYSNTINSSRYAGARDLAANGGSAEQVFGLLGQEGYARAGNYGSVVAGAVDAVQKTSLDDQTISKLSSGIAAAVRGGPSVLDPGWQVPRTGSRLYGQ